MKKLYVSLLAMCFILSSFSQVTNNFESGNREIDKNNCWSFYSTSISTNSKISGTYSMQTGQLSGGLHYLISPWVTFSGTGTLTFSHKMDADQKFDRTLTVQLLDEAGVVVKTLYSHAYPGDKRSVIQASVVIDFSGIFKVKWLFSGSNGTMRGILDDISIPGNYKSNPSMNDGSGNCAVLVSVSDADHDGVADAEDAYPIDPFRAFNNLYPVKDWGSLAFEDLWPSRGDYDFNDLIVDYQITAVTDSKNEIVELKASFLTRAIGASFHNAFALNLLGIPSKSVISVKNSLENANSHGSFKLLDTGVEAEQTWATVIVFDDAFKVLPHPGTGAGVNTTPGGPYVAPTRVDLLITLKVNGNPAGDPVNILDWTQSKMNFFIVVKAREGRGIEIHLPDYHPTDLADRTLFGTMNDGSNLDQSRSYRSKTNLPWAINLLSSFSYPVEKADIIKAHTKFGAWAESGGEEYPEWYQELSNYRNYDLIYKH